MSQETKKSRGRPRLSDNPTIAKSDEIIAKTVYRLLMVGFPLRSSSKELGITETTALIAKTSLHRVDSNGLALSRERIEQIYENWLTKKKRETLPNSWPMPQRWRYTKESLRQRCPDKAKPLSALVELLIQNNGEWPKKSEPRITSEDLVLTPKAWEKLGEPPIFILTFDDPEKQGN